MPSLSGNQPSSGLETARPRSPDDENCDLRSVDRRRSEPSSRREANGASSVSIDAPRRHSRLIDHVVARMGSLALDYGLDFDGVQRPAHRVGGDFLDLFALNDERLCIVLGDVSDKGAAAARTALRLRGALRQNMRGDEDPARALQAMNRQMFNAAEGTQFATLALLIWQADGHVTYVNAGHLPPMVRDGSGSVQWLKPEPNVALGLMPDARFRVQATRLEVGETLMLYTDGLSEARADEGFFGKDRAATAFGRVRTATGVVKALEAFLGSPCDADDVAIVTLGRR